MMNFASLRSLIPVFPERLSYSCISRVFRVPFSSTASHSSNSTIPTDPPLSENDDVNPSFINRNPRNLEKLGIAKKRKGWRFQYPRKNFYHKLMFERSNRHVMGRVEHSSGLTVVSASTKEFAIAKHLYSLNDISASMNVGRILARRCLEAGITCMVQQPPESAQNSEKYQVFQEAMEEGGIDLSEPREVFAEYEPGINYENEEEMKDLIRRQKLVAKEKKRTVFEYGLTRKKVKVKHYFS